MRLYDVLEDLEPDSNESKLIVEMYTCILTLCKALNWELPADCQFRVLELQPGLHNLIKNVVPELEMQALIDDI